MWGGFLLLVPLVAAHIIDTQAQKTSDGAALRCKDVRKLLSSTDSITLDVDTLAAVDGGLKHILDCLPQHGAVQFDMTELKLDETLQIEQSVAIKGSLTSITCMKDTTQPAIEIRSNDVLLGGFNFVGCNLNSTSGLIQVKGAENVTLTDMVFESNVNTNGPSCLLAINSTIEIQNATAKNNRGVYGGAMSFVRGSEVVVVNSSFESNNATQQGGAIHMNNTNLDLSNSRFTENLALDDGGAIFAVASVQSSILRITGSTFQGNSATSTGGALWFGGTFKCSIEKSTFKRNKANVAGGAIFGSKLSWVKLSATSFLDNSCEAEFSPSKGVSVESGNKSADTKGGAVLLSDVLEIRIVESNFAKNQAQSGGAFFVNAFAPVTTNLEVSGTTFERNSAEANGLGGAMALLGDEISVQLDNVTFLDNMAEGRGGSTGGGAIWGGQIRSIKISRSIFSRNKAVEQETDDGEQEGSFWGGALFLAAIPEIAIEMSTFTGNQAAQMGGAIEILAAGLNRSDTNIIGCTFNGNSAVADSRATFGGALDLTGDGLRATIKGSNFTKNEAKTFGGAVYVLGFSGLEISHCSFLENKAVKSERNRSSGISISGAKNLNARQVTSTFGGAIVLQDVSKSVIVNSSFSHNEAENGGGIYSKESMLLVEGSSLQDSVASKGGGAISLLSTNATIIKSNFTRNIGGNDGGGAIASGHISSMAEAKPYLKTKDLLLKDNSAPGSGGGAIRSLGVNLEMEGCLCQNNSAGLGGVIYVTHFQGVSPSATIKATKFIGNGADVGGGMYVQNGDVSMSDCAFESNVAQFKGGALNCEDETLKLSAGNKNSVLTVHSSNFTGNKAGKPESAGVESIKSRGGAVGISGLGLASEFKDCNFSRNVATIGGAVHIRDAIGVTLEGCSFQLGVALTGGALSVISTAVKGNNLTFVGNAAKVGGAAYFTQFDTAALKTDFDVVVFRLAKFVDNFATEGGGAVDLRERIFECDSCLFDSNSAGFGGNEIGSGGAIRALPASNLTLLNSSVINCTASQSGGGIYLEDAIFRGENLTIGINTAIENGGGFAMHFASFASSQLVPWRCSSCGIRGNQAKTGGGLHVSADELRRPNCQAAVIVEELLGNCQRSLMKIDLPETEVRLDSSVFHGNMAEDSGSDIFLSNFKNNVCCDDLCWSKESALDEGVEKCGLGPILQEDETNSFSLGSVFESVSISPSGVPKHSSGEELQAIKITPLDSFGQVAMDNVTLRVEVATPGGELFGSPVTSEGVLMSGHLIVTGMFMRGLPGRYNLSFKLTSQDGNRVVTEVMPVDIRECVIGEVSRDKGLRCDRCADDFFSFDVTDENCTPCPVEEAKCSGGILVPLDGFWHSGPLSSQLHACLTEEACTYPNRTEILFASNLNSSEDYPQCAQGYRDRLCGSCDTSHGKSRFKCTKCQGGVPAGLGIGVVMLALAVLSLIYVKSAAKYSEGVLGNRSDAKSASNAAPSGSHGGFNLPAFIVGEIPDQHIQTPPQNDPPRKSRPSDIFKILVNFFQVTGSAAAINVGWTRSMLMLFTSWDITSGVADSNSFFSLECAFSSGKNNLPRSIQTSIFLAFVPFMVWAVLVTVHYGHASGGKKSFKGIRLWSCVALLAVQQASYISVTRTLVRIFYCVDVSPVEGLFWVQDTSVRCYTGSHAFLVGFVGAPGLLLISIGFPGWLLFKLTRSTERLEKEEVVRQYGFLYQAYKKNVAAWEVVILLRKALLAAVVVFGRTLGEGVQASLALVVMVGSIVLQTQFQPFLESKLNFLELGSLVISTLAFIIGNLVDQPEMTHGGRVAMSVIFIFTAVIYIAYMLKQIFDGVFVELRETMEKSNSGRSLPTGNFKLLVVVAKSHLKKTKNTLNKKKAMSVKKRFFSFVW